MSDMCRILVVRRQCDHGQGGRMKRGATRACSTAHHPGPSEHILGPSSRAADTSRSLFRAAYRAIDRGPTAYTVRHRLGELLMLQFDGKLDGYLHEALHAGQGGGCGGFNALGECQRPRGSSAASPVTPGKKWDARRYPLFSERCPSASHDACGSWAPGFRRWRCCS